MRIVPHFHSRISWKIARHRVHALVSFWAAETSSLGMPAKRTASHLLFEYRLRRHRLILERSITERSRANCKKPVSPDVSVTLVLELLFQRLQGNVRVCIEHGFSRCLPSSTGWVCWREDISVFPAAVPFRYSGHSLCRTSSVGFHHRFRVHRSHVSVIRPRFRERFDVTLQQCSSPLAGGC